MKSIKLTGIRQMEITEVPEPVVTSPLEVKIRVLAVGVCGSDIHYYTRGNIGSQKVTYPFTVGHESAGVVVDTGKLVSRVKPGDIIAIEPAMWCGKCDQCLAGRHHTCRELRFLGCPGQAEGSLAEYIVMPESSCFPLPPGLNPDHGVISEPLAIGIYSVIKAGQVKNQKIAILGFGPIGMSVMLAAKASEADEIYVTDKIEERLSVSYARNASWSGNPDRTNIVEVIKKKVPEGLDVVFECCGQQEAVDQAVNLLKPGGRLVIVGIPEFDKWHLNVDITRRHELSVQFIRRQVGCVDPALEMMKNGKIDISGMITHRFPFSRTKEAFDLVSSYADGVMKAMIDF